VATLSKVRRKRACHLLEGEPPQQVASLMDYLEAKGLMGS
jgi:hypothetical protein